MMMMINKWSLPDVPPAPPRAKALLEREKEHAPEPESQPFRRTNTAGELIHGPEPKPESPPKPVPNNDPSKVETLRLRVEAVNEAPPPPNSTFAALQAYKVAADALPESLKIDIIKDGYIEVPYADQGQERWGGGGGRIGNAKGGYYDGQGEDGRKYHEQVDSLARQKQEFCRLDNGRSLPKTISGILTDIWNDTIERLNVEFSAELFWSQYDWTSEDAPARLQRLPEGAMTPSKTEQSERLMADDPQWTKESIETLLRTVGVECSYKTGKSLRATGRWMLMHRDHFLLRSQSTLRWDHVGDPNFLTHFSPSKHDRVFGDMVEQVAKEEKKKKEELEAKAKEENGGVKCDRARAKEAKAASNKSGSEGKPKDSVDDGATDKPVILQGVDAGKTEVAQLEASLGNANVPVKTPEQAKAEIEAAAKEIVEKEEQNAVEKAQAKSSGKPLAMEDIAAAFSSKDEKVDGPLVWSWRDITERWRWLVYDARAHLMEAGGWEELDWKVFGKPDVEGEGVEDVFEPRVIDNADPQSYEWNL